MSGKSGSAEVPAVLSGLVSLPNDFSFGTSGNRRGRPENPLKANEVIVNRLKADIPTVTDGKNGAVFGAVIPAANGKNDTKSPMTLSAANAALNDIVKTWDNGDARFAVKVQYVGAPQEDKTQIAALMLYPRSSYNRTASTNSAE